MKGTIMIFLQMKSYPLIALIPVPIKGTIFSLLFSLGFNPRTREGYDMEAEERPYLICALIPVPVKGTIIALHILKN